MVVVGFLTTMAARGLLMFSALANNKVYKIMHFSSEVFL
jgi:hypothetical protein